MKVAIVGSRTFNDYQKMVSFIEQISLERNLKITEIISGGAKGADALGERFAREHGYALTVFPAEWDKYGKSAGFRRNITIIENCDVCFAFWDGISKGTKHDIDLCDSNNKECFICKF